MKGNVSHEAEIEQSAILLILRFRTVVIIMKGREEREEKLKRESGGKHIQMTLNPFRLKTNTRGWLEG